MIGKLLVGALLPRIVLFILKFILQTQNLVSQEVCIALLPIELALHDTLGITLQSALLMSSLSLKLLLSEFPLKVLSLFPRDIQLLTLLIDLTPEVCDLVIKTLLVCDSLVLEVLDDVELVLLQDIVVRVQLVVLLLKTRGLLLGLLAQAVVKFKLLGHLLELLFF